MVLKLALLVVFLCIRSTTPAAPAAQGIILSGGYGALTSVEVIDPSTGQSCSLPSLPEERHSHTMDGLLICGGYKPFDTTCLSFSSGGWITSNTLVERRYRHTSWQTDKGVVLMGGIHSDITSEIVPMGGEQGVSSFYLRHETRYACSMPDLTSDSVVITGGLLTLQTVSRYDLQGYVEGLPSLLVGRKSHGCGSYLRGDGTQVLLVAGGVTNGYSTLSSTEVLTKDSSAWTMATPLPKPLSALRGVTASNILYMTGGDVGDGNYRNEVWKWMDEEQEWEAIANAKVDRSYHAVTTIKLDDPAMQFCV